METSFSGAYSNRIFQEKAMSQPEGGATRYKLVAYSADALKGTVTKELQSSASSTVKGVLSEADPSYAAGSQVLLTAIPYDGYEFDHWSGDSESRSRSVLLVMNHDITMVAHFRAKTTGSSSTPSDNNKTFTVKVSCDETMGRVNPRGETGVRAGDQIAITATPKEGYHFVGWSGLLSTIKETPTLTLTVDRNYDIVAVFAKNGTDGPIGGYTTGGSQKPDLVEKAISFVKKWWWAILVAAFIYHETKKGGLK